MLGTIYRAKAPLRLGLGGGGTDLESYSSRFGGAILNATISMYAYATIRPLSGNIIILNAIDQQERIECVLADELIINGKLDILKGVYNRIIREFRKEPFAFELTTYVDAPPGSGLGSSSTLVVAIIGAFVEYLKLPLGEYDIAHLAWEIERKDLGQEGGKQDQYAATFGGFNFMEFGTGDRVVVNPLRVKDHHKSELELNFLLYYTNISRYSSNIIKVQSNNLEKGQSSKLNAMHNLRTQAFELKEAILKGDLHLIGQLLDYGWQEKKKTAAEISSPLIDEVYSSAIDAGATGGKVSGAGGGGFIMFYCPQNARYQVIDVLKNYGGEFRRFSFTENGLSTWNIKSAV
jgi:D-glycero-alpha-D-manno-heptose-7-phosphate kinase